MAHQIVRRELTRVSLKPRQFLHSRDKAFETWTREATSNLRHDVFDADVPVDGVTVTPSSPWFTRVMWRLPAIQMAERAARALKTPRTTAGIDKDIAGMVRHSCKHSDFAQSWKERCKMYRHDAQKQWGRVKATVQTASMCRLTPSCFCDRLG
jgi:hypothetical protein